MVTPFQKRVFDAARLVPRGSVTTYAWLARYIGCGSARAVGQALRRNPYAPRVPCHRVIASDGSIGGFAGKRSGPQVIRKLTLLEQEGVFFSKNGRLIDHDCLYDFSRVSTSGYSSQ